jgi:5S rRNA maturation endonuclease (ribonuclease M5)
VTTAAASASSLLERVVAHYHRTLCTHAGAQAYLARRGLTNADLLKTFQIGYADGSLLKRLPRAGEVREHLRALGILTAEGRELLGGCVIVPIPDPRTGAWTTLYGRGVRTARHCYLPGPLRGVLNFQAARSSDTVILTEAVLDALSFQQAGIATAIPIYGTHGCTADHLDLLTREHVRTVILALDHDDAGRTATATLTEKLTAAGIAVRVAAWPEGVKDANELLVSTNGNAPALFRHLIDAAEPIAPAAPVSVPATPAVSAITRDGDALVLHRDAITYRARVYPPLLGRLRATVKATREGTCHVDTLDLYASRSRTEFARRAAKGLGVDADSVERDLLAILVEAEQLPESDTPASPASGPPPTMTEAERAEALAFLRRADLLDQVARDIDALGFVGETTNTRLLYLVAISRKLADPLSAIVLSQSGAGKSGLTEVLERLTPPEDVVLLTRLTPQSLYYLEPGFLDRKLVIVEERYGSMEADYSIRVLQSRKKLIAAAPIKNPQTGTLTTKVFTVEARAAFLEATTASAVNHENATRCFELLMDESPEQTRRIQARMALLRTERGLALRHAADAIARRHWHAQRLLDSLPVVIPFADALTFPSAWLRTRRDYARFLNLIEVSAFLHQYQRPRRGGAIIAEVADYAVAYALAASVLTETLADLRKPLREAYARIRALCGDTDRVMSRREIRDALAVPDSTVRRWLADLVELDYLDTESSRGGQGKSARYRVADTAPRPEIGLGLLTPDALAAQLGRRA